MLFTTPGIALAGLTLGRDPWWPLVVTPDGCWW